MQTKRLDILLSLFCGYGSFTEMSPSTAFEIEMFEFCAVKGKSLL